MKFTTVTTDGVYPISDGPTKRDFAGIYFQGNTGAHSFQIGYSDMFGAFQPIQGGAIVDDSFLFLGYDLLLMVQVSGMTGGDQIIIGYAG